VGERQSAYVGAVAAMSESKSFLEERIEHMIRKPVRWRRLGAATLACFSIALTALAAQVSPPNAESPAPVAGKPAPVERKEITLGDAALDRYVGTYKLGDTMIFTVKRDGKYLQAQLTGQQFIEMYPESETKFFYKAIDAQLEFKLDPSGGVESVTLFQHGNVVPMPRIDGALAQQIQADLAAKIASQAPTPGSEAALRRLNDGIASGKPNYDEMDPFLSDAVKKQLQFLQPGIASLGPLKSLTFRNVTGQGHDLYLATYEKGTMAWRISMRPDGKIANALVTPDY